MTPIQRTLLAIAAFVSIAVGTFVYFVTQWDASKAEPIGLKRGPMPFTWQTKLRGLGQRPSPALSMRTPA